MISLSVKSVRVLNQERTLKWSWLIAAHLNGLNQAGSADVNAESKYDEVLCMKIFSLLD